MKKKTIFEGSCVAIVTPFNQDGSVNYQELERLIEFQIENETDAIVTCGTTGESATLSTEEHIEVVRFTVEKVAKRVPVIAGTGSNDTAYAVDLSIECEKVGVDALLLVTPYYNKTSQKGLVESFFAVADVVNIPCIIYNVPSRTGVNILPETYLKLSVHENIVAVKEANHDVSSVAQTIALCGDALDIYSGEDNQTLPIIALGGKGVISVFANIMPKEMHDLAKAALNDDFVTAREMTSKYIQLMDSLFVDVNPIPVKEALVLMGYDCKKFRLPLVNMDDDKIETLTSVMTKYQVI